MFEDGIKYYTEATIDKTVYFPEDVVCCKYCDFCRAEKELGRYWCRLTNEMLYNPAARILPDKCPLVFKEEKDEQP